MHKSVVKGKRTNNRISNAVSEWDRAIRDAEQRIRRLRQSIRIFRQMKNSGEPWRDANYQKTKTI
jgi:hypothetical protein